jgi:N-acyl amino acid synthase of PEP-CTERM/exosortase system
MRSYSTPDRHFRRALELRYQVYCLECSFLSPHEYANGVETDEHDDAAAHFYAFDSHDELVGYVRLVRPDIDQRFPFHKHCTTSAGDIVLPVPGQAAEISRLMVRRDYRRVRHAPIPGAKAGQKIARSPGEKRHEAPEILMNLYRQMYAYSRAHGIEHWYAAMERPLARSLRRMSIAFRPIGPQTDYYGLVTPYLASVQELESQVGARNPRLLAWLQQTERHGVKTSCGEDWGLTTGS